MFNTERQGLQSPKNKESTPLWDRYQCLTMPQGALGGVMEPVLSIMAQLGVNSLSPAAALFASSHGVSEKHPVSAYPPSVTAQMVLNFLQGGAAMSVLAKRRQIPLWVVDVGVSGLHNPTSAPAAHMHFVQTSIFSKFGLSQSIDEDAALSSDHFDAAWQAGVDTVDKLLDSSGTNLILLGEMGIGNSTLATSIACGCLQIDPTKVVGPGTGIDPKGLHQKAEVIQKALKRHTAMFGLQCSAKDWLRSLGGCELVAMAGAAWRASHRNTYVLVDGAICSAALCPLVLENPKISEWFIASHLSPEPIHQILLDFFNTKPILNARLRLGEGSGAALVLGLFQDAEALLNEMATFQTAQVDNRV